MCGGDASRVMLAHSEQWSSCSLMELSQPTSRSCAALEEVRKQETLILIVYKIKNPIKKHFMGSLRLESIICLSVDWIYQLNTRT